MSSRTAKKHANKKITTNSNKRGCKKKEIVDLPDDHYNPLDSALISHSDITSVKKGYKKQQETVASTSLSVYNDNKAQNKNKKRMQKEAKKNFHDALSDNDTFNSDDDISSDVDEFVNHDHTITSSNRTSNSRPLESGDNMINIQMNNTHNMMNNSIFHFDTINEVVPSPFNKMTIY
ncbi:17323_t:CDS:2 [Racocetra persica]|uniref:17323_t:CDS:1 n=1 Tax=Racocetra persica TaxID=160502 RepID=A0ACA9QZD6_9GLOM|nr:17323_t:CDS:2 [Racocetra persica]